MRSAPLSLAAAYSVLAAMAACSQSTRDVEKTAKTAEALTSAEFSIACEPGTSPSVDVRGGVGLAAWIATDGTIHAARFDQGGNVLDAVPLALGLPSAPFETTPIAHQVLVIPTVAGFAVASELDSHLSMPPAFNYHRAQYRTVDLSGTISSPWTLVYEEGDSGSILASLSLLSGGFDGTHSYLAFDRMQAQGQAHPHWKHVYQLGGGSVLQVAPLNAPLGSPTWFDPTWGGFGCGASGCLATWKTPQTDVPTAQVLGQSPVTGTAFVQGSVVATPSGFLQTGTQSLAFSPAGVVTAGPTNLAPFGAGYLSSVYDGTATRAVWTIPNQGLYSATLADDTTVTSGPTLEVAGSLNVSLASFGAGRAVVVYGASTGVFGRFMGSLPASLPPEGCSGSGGAGAGGAGGASGASTSSTTSGSSSGSSSATTASSSSSGGATTSSSSAGGATAATGAGGAATSSSSSSGGGAGGATSSSGASTSSTASSGGSPTVASSGATTDATSGAQSSSSSGAGGGAETSGGGCVIAHADSDPTSAWPLVLAVASSVARRRRSRSQQ